MAAVVNQWNSPQIGGGVLSYTGGYHDGLTVIQTAHSAGNTLAVFVGMTNTPNGGNAPTIMNPPVAYVADDAHNFWVPLVTSAKLGAYRGSIWACTNARQGDPATGKTQVSISATGRTLIVGACVVEFSGMPALAQLSGMESSSFTNSGTTVTASGTASGTAWGFSMCASLGNITVTPTSPWTALTAFQAANGIYGVNMVPMWGSIPSGAQSVTFTSSVTEGMTVCLGGILQSPVTPVQPNPNAPLFKVEAAFGANPGDITAMPSWTDISQYAMDENGSTTLRTSRGRDYELTAPEAGEIELLVDNHTGVFNPANTTGPFYPHVALQLPLRVSAYINGRWHWVGNGRTTRLPQQWPDPQWGMSPLTAYDGMGVLANATLFSAYIQEILTDGPYSYHPLGESYTEANGLPFANLAPGNPRPMLGLDGNPGGAVTLLTTGQQLSLVGDTGSGVGISGLSSVISSWSAGLLYTDPNFPQYTANGLTVEFWAITPIGTVPTWITPLISLIGSPGNYCTPPIMGPLKAELLNYQVSGPGTQVLAADNTGASGNTAFTTIVSPTDVNPHHYVLLISGNVNPTFQLYFDGVSVGSWTSSVGVSSDLAGMIVGPATIYGANIKAFNYVIGHVATYASLLTQAQITDHFNAGLAAFSGETAVTRFSHLMTWAGTGLAAASDQGSAAPLMGVCDTISGQAVSDAIADVTTSEGGTNYVAADGAVFYQSRTALYNKKPKWVFGDFATSGYSDIYLDTYLDAAEIPYLADESFDMDVTYLYNRIQAQRQISSQQVSVDLVSPITGLPTGALTTQTYTDLGADVIAFDATSEAEYAVRGSLSGTVYTTSDEDAYDWANWKLNKYKQPSFRVPTIQIDAASNPSVWDAMLSVEQGDVVTVNRRPLGAPAYSVLGVVQKIELEAGPGVGTFTLAISPYSIEANVLQLGRAGFNTLGSSRVGW